TNTSWVIAIGSLWNKENMTLAYTALDINADDDWNFANNGSAINISTWAYIDSKAGNAPLALAVGTSVAIPIMTREAHDAMLLAGATEEQADQLGLPIGVLLAGIEVMGDIPYLKGLAPTVLRAFRKEVSQKLANQAVKNIAKSRGRVFVKTAGLITFIETLEEDAQLIVINAAKKIFDENQDIFQDLGRTTIESALVMAPFGVFGGLGASFHRVAPSRMQGLTDAEMQTRGWVQEPQTGHWYQRLRDVLKEESGFVVPGEFLPGGPEEIRPARITKETWDATLVEQRVTQATDAGLEGKVGSKSFADLTTAEIDVLSAIRPAIPKAEPGMPEAGLQPPLIPGVPTEEVRPKGRGEIVQISMEDQLKLEQARRDAEEAPDDGR
ncbi:hypothetical protein LCGC14_2918130, partial [marine sediment metagenome]